MESRVSETEQDVASRSGGSLRSNAVGLTGAVIMSAALMGPAVSTYFNPQLSAGFAGAAVPLVFLVSLVAVVIVANGVMEMARELPSAGAFYTYVARGVGGRTGFVTGALMFVAYALLVPAELALIGVYTHDLLHAHGIDIHWAVISLFFAAAMTFLAFEGIQGSLRTALVLFGLEVAIILLLITIVLVKGGHGGLSLAPFNPAESPKGLSGIALGMVFGVLSFVGFEAAATLGEEVREPRRNVPRGILYSLLLVGAIYLFATYGEIVGFGTDGIANLTGNAAPFNTLAQTYAPWLDLFVGLAGISSIFAVIMNSNNGIVRILFAMGRERMLPRSLAHIDAKRGTPSTAIFLQAAFAVVVTLAVGFWTGPLNAYAYLGSLLTLGIIPVYILVNFACMRFFRLQRREHFAVVRHLVLPVLGVLLMLIPIYGLVWPVPDPPYNYFPYAIIAYIAITALVAWQLGRRRPETLLRAGAVLASEDTGKAQIPVEEHRVPEAQV